MRAGAPTRKPGTLGGAAGWHRIRGVDALQVLRAAATEALVGRHVYIFDTTNTRPPSPELSDLLTRLQVSTLLKPFDIDHLLEVVVVAAERLA